MILFQYKIILLSLNVLRDKTKKYLKINGYDHIIDTHTIISLTFNNWIDDVKFPLSLAWLQYILNVR